MFNPEFFEAEFFEPARATKLYGAHNYAWLDRGRGRRQRSRVGELPVNPTPEQLRSQMLVWLEFGLKRDGNKIIFGESKKMSEKELEEIGYTHPSLTVKPQSPQNVKDDYESLKEFVRQVEAKASSISENASVIQKAFEGVDAVGLLADMQAELKAFKAEYSPILSKIASRVDAETEFLNALKAKLKAI